MPIASINPTNGEILKKFQPLSEREIEDKLRRAAEVFPQYRCVPLSTRAERLRRAAEILETDKEQFARTMTLEMGKPIQAARDEVLKCATGCRYYAEHGAAHLAQEIVESSATRSYVRYD